MCILPSKTSPTISSKRHLDFSTQTYLDRVIWISPNMYLDFPHSYVDFSSQVFRYLHTGACIFPLRYLDFSTSIWIPHTDTWISPHKLLGFLLTGICTLDFSTQSRGFLHADIWISPKFCGFLHSARLDFSTLWISYTGARISEHRYLDLDYENTRTLKDRSPLKRQKHTSCCRILELQMP